MSLYFRSWLSAIRNPEPLGVTTENVKVVEVTEDYQSLPVNYCDPVVLLWEDEDSTPRFSSASGTYIQLGSRSILVTNAHVYREFECVRERFGRAVFHVGGRDLKDVDSRFIDVDEGSDLATIDLAGVTLTPRDTARGALQTRHFFSPATAWPAEASTGDIVSFGGWPGVLRKDEPDNRGAEFNPYTITNVPITSATRDSFRVRVDRSKVTYSFGRTSHDEDEKDFDFRGMSGAPVLRRREGITELVGIVTEYLGFIAEGDILVDTFVMTNASSIKSDGTLRHNIRRLEAQ